MRSSNYNQTKVIVLAVVQILVGLLSISLGVASATPYYAGNYPYGHLGYGIFCGVLCIINAILGIIAAKTRNPDLIVWHLILSVCVCVLGVLQFALGTAAANQDYTIVRYRGLVSGMNANSTREATDYFVSYDDFLRTYFPMTRMLASPSNALTQYVYNGTVAVDALLAVAGILMALFAAVQAACGCRVTCCQEIFDERDSIVVMQGDKPASARGYNSTIVANKNYVPDD